MCQGRLDEAECKFKVAPGIKDVDEACAMSTQWSCGFGGLPFCWHWLAGALTEASLFLV